MTRLFNQELARPGSPLRGIDLGSGRFPELTGLGYRYLSRPMFFGEGRCAASRPTCSAWWTC